MKIIFSLLLSLLSSGLFAQHNLLGKSMDYITDYYKFDPEYTVNIDTIRTGKVMITCKSPDIYPYHTYEINTNLDKCISYGFVSKNHAILETYVEVLGHIGTLLKADSSFTNFIYVVELPQKEILYSFKHPFAESRIKTRRDIFYVMITQKDKKIAIND